MNNNLPHTSYLLLPNQSKKAEYFSTNIASFWDSFLPCPSLSRSYFYPFPSVFKLRWLFNNAMVVKCFR